MDRRITRHATRLAAAQETAAEGDFARGERVMTADGLPGVVSAVEPGFTRGAAEYTVTLDRGMGGGAYSAGQLRSIASQPQVTAALDEVTGAEVHLASEDYPEMGSVLHERPDPGREISVIGSLRKTASSGYDEANDMVASEPFGDRGQVYRGLNVHLPPDVHRLVHDPDRPEQERGFHLARYLISRPHPDPAAGAGLGRDWHFDSWKAHLIRAEEEGGRDPRKTPVMIRAHFPDREHILSEHELPDYWRSRGWPQDREHDERNDGIVYRHGAPVAITAISWSHPEHDVPGSGHEMDTDNWLDFPEPIQVKAGLYREAAWARPLDESWDYRQTPGPWWERGEEWNLPGDSLMRGMHLHLPPDVHRIVHDESRPEHERGLVLARHILTHRHPDPVAGEGLGYSWTSDPEHARLNAEYPYEHSEVGGTERPTGTPVVLHARTPDRETWENDPYELRERDQQRRAQPQLGGRGRFWDRDPDSYPYAEGSEVALKRGSSLPFTGLSWAAPGHRTGISMTDRSVHDDPEYHHLSFPEPMQAKASLRREAAGRWWYDDPSVPPEGHTMYRGTSFYLPAAVHRIVHDESRPAHERGHAMARFLVGTHIPDQMKHGYGAGRAWTDDPESAMSYSNHQDLPWEYPDAPDEITPVVLHARTAPREHREEDEDELARRDEEAQVARLGPPQSPAWREIHMKSGHPVDFTGVSWGKPNSWNPEFAHRPAHQAPPRTIEEARPVENATWGDFSGPHRDAREDWTHFHLPEPFRTQAARQGDMERHLTLPRHKGGHGMPPEIMRAHQGGPGGLEGVHDEIHATHDFGEHDLGHHHGGPSAWEYGSDAAGAHQFVSSLHWIPADAAWEE